MRASYDCAHSTHAGSGERCIVRTPSRLLAQGAMPAPSFSLSLEKPWTGLVIIAYEVHERFLREWTRDSPDLNIIDIYRVFSFA